MSQSETWTHVRVRKATLARMQLAARRIVQLVEEGIIPDPGVNPEPKNPAAIGLSMDQLITVLLDERDAHNRRARESRRRRRDARKQPADGNDPPAG